MERTNEIRRKERNGMWNIQQKWIDKNKGTYKWKYVPTSYENDSDDGKL